MNSVIDVLDAVSQDWWACVFTTTWQSSLVVLVLAGFAWSFRRLPSTLRYGLLLIALAKFAAPPLLATPTGLFSRLSLAIPGVVAHDAAALPEAGHAVGVVQVEAVPHATDRAATEAPVRMDASRGVGPSAVQQVTPAVAAVGASLGRMGWRSWLMLAHGLGCLVTGAWIVFQLVRLGRVARNAEDIVSGALYEGFARLSEEMGLRRPARLLMTSETVAPMAFGIFRPVVLIPAGVVKEFSAAQTSAMLAHELAHHRRWDPWLNWGQLVLAVVWWFNPLVWVLNRILRSVREECCDDLILHGKLTTGSVYGETLLRLAKILSRSGAARRTCGYAPAMHPLGRRLIRVMDATRPRAARLSPAGVVLVMLLAAVVLPGVSTQAGRPKEPDAAEGPRADPAVTQAQAAPAPTFTLAGTVIDPDGQPLAGVRVRSHVIVLPSSESTFNEASTVTNDQGHFELAGLVPMSGSPYQKPSDENPGIRRLSFGHPDFAMAEFGVSAKRRTQPGFDFEQIGIQLADQSSLSVVVADEAGRPVRDAIVSFTAQGGGPTDENGRRPLSNDRSYNVSSGVWSEDPLRTDSEGRCLIEKLPELSVVRIRVKHPHYETYDSRTEFPGPGRSGREKTLYAGDHDLRVQLSPGATIQGRLTRDGVPVKKEGLVITARRPSSLPTAATTSRPTDEEGRFELTGLAEGTYAVHVDHRMLLVGDYLSAPIFGVQATAGSVKTGLDLACIEGRTLTGRVTDRKNGQPLEDKGVSARAGEAPSITLSFTRTDPDGRYRLRVPPGQWKVRTSEWRDGGVEEVAREVVIPSDEPVPDVDFALATPPELRARLVDENGRPVAGTLVFPEGRQPVELGPGEMCRIPVPRYRPIDVFYGFAFNREKSQGILFSWHPRDFEAMRELVLRPLATVRGRAVDESGVPVVGSVPSLMIMEGESVGNPMESWNPPVYDLEIGPDGTFALRGLPAPVGPVLGLTIHRAEPLTTPPDYQRVYDAWLTLQDPRPGETLDLGDVVLKRSQRAVRR